MKTVRISDMTLREGTIASGSQLSFKEKIEIARMLDRVRLDVIELPEMTNTATDSLLIKSVASAVEYSTVAVSAGTTTVQTDLAWNAVSGAKKPRLTVSLPTSNVQMEYISHCKPDKMLALITDLVSHAKKLCADVEFSAVDATRSDIDFLSRAVEAAIHAGAGTVTLCDTASVMLPGELCELIGTLYRKVPALTGIELGVACGNELCLANACALSAVTAGALLVKSAVAKTNLTPVESFVHLIRSRGDSLGLVCGVNVTELSRTVKQIKTIAKTKRTETTPFDNKIGTRDPAQEMIFDEKSDIATVSRAIEELGYTLSDDDTAKVYEELLATAKKRKVGMKELDVIVASESLQVAPTYKLLSYVVNSGNIITPTAHIMLTKNGETMSGLCSGDGPIDAALLCVEKIVGHHYELDDFQIQAVTEGTSAMGEAIVKLRCDGMLYSGRGISTDIIGASVRAYLNALNKIVYGEK